ncbi:carbohydrate ABC transporter membrane protein 1 (CUT1 family) [Propionibacteriaceae bacterium ES.041]|uniref:carbohydrate ABC transporter permease n=1 Tax=Enemella evansiae TaxID=2016499 RepID=UPI000B969904|nr:sugar ABC transporter permease [Enemella evansiae]OYN94638.1 permease [Enemella evansiae]PFG67704.1 carbohydrate ABC transporter membrane protein 1 (CUT1 family) [Propionibacteriaceae bacterium ES.041]
MSRTKETNDRRGFGYQWQARAFAGPAIVLTIVLLYLPFLWTAWLSFTEFNGFGSPEWVGLDNYVTMFSDPGILVSIRNTLLWVVGTLVLPVTLGLLIAVLSHGLRGGVWLRLPFLIPYAVSGIAVGVIWTFILQTGGALDEALRFLHIPGAGTRWLLDTPLNTVMMIIAAAWQGSGVNALLFGIGLQSIPKEPLEAARLDGATGWSLFRHITWPLLAPLTTVVVGLSLVGSLKTFDIVWGMTKGGPGRDSETLALSMYKQTFVASDYGVGSALAVLLTVVTVAASVLYLRQQLRRGAEA